MDSANLQLSTLYFFGNFVTLLALVNTCNCARFSLQLFKTTQSSPIYILNAYELTTRSKLMVLLLASYRTLSLLLLTISWF